MPLQEIYGLQVDFIQYGHYMMLYQEGGMQAEKVSLLQMKMLQSNVIPRLLSINLEEIDFYQKLLYNTTSKRMLSQWIKTERLELQDYFYFFYHLVCTLDNSKNYMLDETQFILQTDFIFIGNEITDFYLTYVPLKGKHFPTLLEQLKALAEQLSLKLANEERSILTHLMNGFSEGSYSNFVMKELLLELMKGNKLKQSQLERQVSDDLADVGINDSLDKYSEKSLDGAAATAKRNTLAHSQSSVQTEPTKSKTAAQSTKVSQRVRILTLVGLLFICALLWEHYFEQPSEAYLIMFSGITLLLCDAAFILLLFPPLYGWNRLLLKTQAPMPPYSAPQPLSRQESEPVNMELYYSNLANHTTMLTPSSLNATVLLTSSSPTVQMKGAASRMPVLEMNKEGKRESIDIVGTSFLIGRGEGEVQYVDKTVGVSRIHLEIFKALEGYGVKDLGSRNGTYVNGELLTPYKAYSLEDGDVIRIIRSEFTFKK